MGIPLGQILGELFGAGNVRKDGQDPNGNDVYKPTAPVADILFNRGQGRALARKLNLQPAIDAMELKKTKGASDIATQAEKERGINALPTVLKEYEGKRNIDEGAAIRAGTRAWLGNKGIIPNEAGETFYNTQVRPNDFAASVAGGEAGLNKAQTDQIQSGLGLDLAQKGAPLQSKLELGSLQAKIQDLQDRLELAGLSKQAEESGLKAKIAEGQAIQQNPMLRWIGNLFRSAAPGAAIVNTVTGESTVPNPKNDFRALEGKVTGNPQAAPNTATPGGTPVNNVRMYKNPTTGATYILHNGQLLLQQ